MIEQIEITNPDRSKNQITLFKKEENQDAPIILILPAMGVWAKFYQPFGKELANQNFIAALVDLRGNGKSDVRPKEGADFGYKEIMELDYATTIQALKKKFPNNKLYFLGHSLGGQLAALYLSKNENAADGLILIACCSVYYKRWSGFRGFGTLAMTQFFGLLARLIGYFPGNKVGFGGTEAKTVMIDWSYQARTGNYILQNEEFDYEKALKKLDIPTLVLTFEADTFAPMKAAKHLYQKLKHPEKVNHIHLKNEDSRNEHFNHFNWVKKPKNIVKIIYEEFEKKN